MDISGTSINTANLQYANLSKHKERIRKPSNYEMDSTDTKTTNKDLSVFVSISEESQKMFTQVQEESDEQKEKALFSITGNIVDQYGNKLGETTTLFDSNKWMLVGAAIQTDDEENASAFNFNKLAFAYDDLRKGYASLYSGKKLEEKLSTLDADYQDALNYIADRVEKAARFRAAAEGEKGLQEAFEWLVGKGKDKDLLRKAGINGNQSLMDSIDTIIGIMRNYVMQMGAAAKQSVLNNSTLPYAEESKKDFPDSTRADAEPMNNAALPKKDLKE